MKGSVAAIVVVLVAASVAGGAAAARPEPNNCVLNVDAPFLYVDIVFAPATVSCSSAQNRITLTTVLTRDGVEVARDTRHCTHMAVCHDDVGSFTTDLAGDQTWCTTAWGSVHGTSFPSATVCENDVF